MEDEMTIRMRSGATIRKGTEPRGQGVHAVGTGNGNQSGGFNYDATIERNQLPDKQRNQCYVCKEQHYVDQCPRFQAMTPKKRWEIVKEQRACFSCLKRSKGHTALNCLRKKECQDMKRDGSICKKPHHKLLHDNTSPDQKNVVGSVQDTNNKCGQASVFYDSGVQISMIRDAFAEELELESKPATILIATVGEIEQELNTKLYKVPIYASNGKLIQTIEAVGIPQISQDTATIYSDQVS